MRCVRPMMAPKATEGDPNVHRVLRSVQYAGEKFIAGGLACVPPEWQPRLRREGIIGTPAQAAPVATTTRAAAPSVDVDLPTVPQAGATAGPEPATGIEADPVAAPSAAPAGTPRKKRAAPANGGTTDE